MDSRETAAKIGGALIEGNRNQKRRALRIRLDTRQDAMNALDRDRLIVQKAASTLRDRGARSVASRLDVLIDEWTEQLVTMRRIQETEAEMEAEWTEAENRESFGK